MITLKYNKMKKIYALTGYNMKSKYYTEKAYFTNKKLATKSLFALCRYFNYNYDLNPENTVLNYDKDDLYSVLLDDTYNISLTTFDIKTKELKYM